MCVKLTEASCPYFAGGRRSAAAALSPERPSKRLQLARGAEHRQRRGHASGSDSDGDWEQDSGSDDNDVEDLLLELASAAEAAQPDSAPKTSMLERVFEQRPATTQKNYQSHYKFYQVSAV